MARRLSHLGYADWLNHLFDRPVGAGSWHLALEADVYDGPAVEAVRHMTLLFRDPGWLPSLYSDAQIAAGFDALVGSGAGETVAWLFDSAVPEAARLAWAESQPAVFERLFAPRCTPVLIHRHEPDYGPLNLVCYMWWDSLSILPAPGDRTRAAFDAAMVAAMARVLAIDHPACQEAALHGLGHWAFVDPTAAVPAIDHWLAHGHPSRPDLVPYAQAARGGCIA
jgi:hypothetical protein